jgi:hypothetical protein
VKIAALLRVRIAAMAARCNASTRSFPSVHTELFTEARYSCAPLVIEFERHGDALHPCRGMVPQCCRLKNCTARSCFSAAARVAKVPRLRRRPVRGSTFREYKRYWPDFSLRIIVTLEDQSHFAMSL